MRALIKTSLHWILGLKTLSRAAAWTSLLAIAAFSLVPGEQITRTSLGGHVEHVLAYAGTAFLTATAYGERGFAWITLALLSYAGALEYLQRFSPGRTSSIEDFMFSSAGVLIGVGAFVLLKHISSPAST